MRGFDIKKMLKNIDVSDLPAIIRLVSFGIVIFLACVFCFNLFKFNLNASFSKDEVAKNLKTVGSYDYGKVKTVESVIKKLEAREASSVNVKRKSSIYYIKKFKGNVILGDSITEGLTVYGYLTDEQVFCSIGASLAGSKKIFKKASKTYPDNAFFSFGMNDLITYRGKSKPFIKEYKKKLDYFHKKSPDSNIFINSISRPNKKAQKNQKSLKHWADFNKAIKKMCEERNYTYIDNTYILANNKKLYAPDGIHVDTTYYPMWLDDMITEAGL